MKRRLGSLLAALLFSASVAASPPPFASDLERLAEILGSLQFLAELCEDGRAAAWRGQMEALLELTNDGSETDEAWQARLTDRFNLGYSSFAAVYRRCTTAALAAIDHYREAGAAIAAAIATRYGGLPATTPGE